MEAAALLFHNSSTEQSHTFRLSEDLLTTVFPRIDRARSINFSLSKLRAIIEGALYSRAYGKPFVTKVKRYISLSYVQVGLLHVDVVLTSW